MKRKKTRRMTKKMTRKTIKKMIKRRRRKMTRKRKRRMTKKKIKLQNLIMKNILKRESRLRTPSNRKRKMVNLVKM